MLPLTSSSSEVTLGMRWLSITTWSKRMKRRRQAGLHQQLHTRAVKQPMQPSAAVSPTPSLSALHSSHPSAEPASLQQDNASEPTTSRLSPLHCGTNMSARHLENIKAITFTVRVRK
jgi:hypothetical protein